LLTVNFPPANVIVSNVTVAAGNTITVPVVLLANGNENAVGFSLNFDPTKLSFADATVGADAAAASLLVNSNQLAGGQVGFAIGLPTDTNFLAGTQEVLLVSFTAAVVGSPTSTTIGFGSVPVTQQLSDAHGNPLAVLFTSGIVSILAAEFEGDVSPRPNGDRQLTITDWVLAGRYAARLDFPTNSSEFQRADCAPRTTLGDGQITVSDWVQTGRYVAGLDPLTVAGGPTAEGPVRAAVRAHSPLGRAPKDGSPIRQVEVTQGLVIRTTNATVSVNLEAEGNENALGFSLAFDPTVVTYINTVPGSDATGATIDINANQAAWGHLGFAFALPIGKSFSAGTKEIVKLTFVVASSASGSYPVTLGDQPVPREVSDPQAEPLVTDYINGAIEVNPPPAISFAPSTQNLALGWPAWASNYVLQATDTLLSGPNTWTNLTVNPTLTNDQFTVTLPVTGATKFYRLSK
jgi:hypothetical protein